MAKPKTLDSFLSPLTSSLGVSIADLVVDSRMNGGQVDLLEHLLHYSHFKQFSFNLGKSHLPTPVPSSLAVDNSCALGNSSQSSAQYLINLPSKKHSVLYLCQRSEIHVDAIVGARDYGHFHSAALYPQPENAPRFFSPRKVYHKNHDIEIPVYLGTLLVPEGSGYGTIPQVTYWVHLHQSLDSKDLHKLKHMLKKSKS